jgi:choline dehydrogenase-like flavoprotein
MYVEEALTHGAKIVNYAKVKRVLFEGKKAVGVEFRKGGHTHQAFASRVVISAGGIGTPVILRESGIKRAGYDYFFDPLIGVRGTVNDIDVPASEIPMSAGVHLEDESYMMTDMAHPFATNAIFAAGALRFQHLFARSKTLQIMVKARDELGGKLTDGGAVIKILDKKEKKKLQNGYQRARQIMKKAGAKNIYRTQYIAAHPGGTVKVGDLVDSNLMTEYDNLFVCDCSVIPEAWGMPPTTTIIALGKRLAKYIQLNVN